MKLISNPCAGTQALQIRKLVNQRFKHTHTQPTYCINYKQILCVLWSLAKQINLHLRICFVRCPIFLQPLLKMPRGPATEPGKEERCSLRTKKIVIVQVDTSVERLVKRNYLRETTAAFHSTAATFPSLMEEKEKAANLAGK